MTTSDRFERELPQALADITGSGNADYLTDILGRTARTRQRPAWASLERWLPMDLATPRAATARIPWRPILAVAAIAVILAGLLAVYAGSQRHVPPPFGPARNGLIPYAQGGEIYLGDPISGATRLLVGDPENDYGPTFSPDGTKVAFLRASANCPKPGDVCPGGEDVAITMADGGGARVITSSPLVGIRVATWSADSTSLFVGYGDGLDYRLERIDVADGRSTLVSKGAFIDSVAVNPPDGRDLLVRALVDRQWGLYMIRADGSSAPRLLTPAAVAGDPDQDLNFAHFSPDGSQIYYNRYSPAADTIQAWVMDSDGSNQHRFNRTGPATGWWEGEMAPSPDGQSVAMWRTPSTGDGAARITLYPADGSGPGAPIGPRLSGTALWTWAPDSTRLLVNPNDPADGGQVLVNPKDGTFAPAPWSALTDPDWQRLAR